MATSVPAIVWPINFSLPGGNPLCQGIATSAPAESAPLIQGDQRLLKLYFLAPSITVGGTPANVQLIDGTTISIAGKPTSDLQATVVLFEATGFAQLQDNANLYFSQAFLDLDKQEIIDAFTTLGDGNNSLPCLADVIISVPAQAAAALVPAVPATTARYQIPILLQRQVYLGTESDPSPATPTYPPAADVAAAITKAAAAEPGLGNPATSGMVLASTTAGVRSWVNPGGSGFALHDVATNAAKQALPADTTAPYFVRITGEAGRIEQYMGGGIADDANWLVLRNTIRLVVVFYAANGSPDTLIINGVNCPSYNSTDVGWVDPAAIQFSFNSPYGNQFLINASYLLDTGLDESYTVGNTPLLEPGWSPLSMLRSYPDRTNVRITFNSIQEN